MAHKGKTARSCACYAGDLGEISKKREEIKKRNLPRHDAKIKKKGIKKDGTCGGARGVGRRKLERAEPESPNYKSSEKAGREIHKDI